MFGDGFSLLWDYLVEKEANFHLAKSPRRERFPFYSDIVQRRLQTIKYLFKLCNLGRKLRELAVTGNRGH